MYRLGLSELFACKLDSEAYSFFPQYLNMINWWLSQGQTATRKNNFTAFRNQFYDKWRTDWKGYNSQHAQTSCLFALKALNTNIQSKQELKQSFAIISPVSTKVENKKFMFVTKHAKKAYVELIPKTPTQNILLEQTQNSYWKIGQVFLTPKWCTIPLTRHIDLTKEKDPILQEFLKHTL
ncbi:MAG: hypothetical protein LBE76_00085 [Nitrososphaerota archaeon]|jgi:hypothetical protein|nr:hypothetical protein [Nitrososphaerota archaeon]